MYSLPPPDPPVPPVTTPSFAAPNPPPLALKMTVLPNNISLSSPPIPTANAEPVLVDIPPLPTFTEYGPVGK